MGLTMRRCVRDKQLSLSAVSFSHIQAGFLSWRVWARLRAIAGDSLE